LYLSSTACLTEEFQQTLANRLRNAPRRFPCWWLEGTGRAEAKAIRVIDRNSDAAEAVGH